MTDFQLVDPRGWECDLQSVRLRLTTMTRAMCSPCLLHNRCMPPIWAISSCIVCPGALTSCSTNFDPQLACRHERSWGIFFESFEEFLKFQWPVITVTDCYTGKAHIVTRMGSIGAFIKMIKTRWVPSIVQAYFGVDVPSRPDSARHCPWWTTSSV